MVIFIAALLAWSLVSCFFPLKETVLRTLVVINAGLVSIAMFACAIPALTLGPTILLHGLLLLDPLRALYLLCLAVGWSVLMCVFVLWWGESFARGTGVRSLFCVRSTTLIFGFSGIVFTLLAAQIHIAFLSALLVLGTISAAGLFHVSDRALPALRSLVLMFGACAVVGGFGILFLVLFPAYTIIATSFIACGFFGIFGLFPGTRGVILGIAEIPQGHRLLLRAFFPLATAPHFFALASTGEYQHIFLIFAILALITGVTWFWVKDTSVELWNVGMASCVFASFAYGTLGAIPALMFFIPWFFFGSGLALARGGLWWTRKERYLALALLAACPVVSPLFLPWVLSVGYGAYMQLPLALALVCVGVGIVYVLSTRMLRMWNEEDARPFEMWSARSALLLFGIAGIFGIWFFSESGFLFFSSFVQR